MRRLQHPAQPQAEGPPFIGYPRVLVQYIRCYSPHLEVIPSIHNLRRHHDMAAGTGLSWAKKTLQGVGGSFTFKINLEL
jgi:hypothetical protein